MKRGPCTTAFEDLILGSQFVPILTQLGALKCEQERDESDEKVGVFQCKQCKGTFLQEKEALLHYKSHVLASHEEYFEISIGDICARRDCTFIENQITNIHYHCNYCSFSGSEILDLPLHMEDQHLSFYKKVSLILSHEDAQLNKVYTCGECNVSIQGKVSIVQHLLTNGSCCARPNITVTEMNPDDMKFEGPLDLSTVVNGSVEHANDAAKSVNGDNSIEEGEQEEEEFVHENNVMDISPMNLIASLIEQDFIRTQHFLLGAPEIPQEAVHFEEYTPDPVEVKEEVVVTIKKEVKEMPQINLALNAYMNQISSPGVFQCNQCNEGFKYQYLLVAHRKQAHQNLNQTRFKCSSCISEFATLADLKRHTTVKHSAEKSFFCHICGHCFSEHSSLVTHLREHEKKFEDNATAQVLPDNASLRSPEKVSCETCAEEFASKGDLNRHIVRFQGTCNSKKTASLRCITCNEEILTLEALKEHRKTFHPTDANSELRDTDGTPSKKGFQCDYCGKTFGCRSNLRDHLVVHTGDKPYPCDICGKAFSFLHNMKTHRHTHNQGRSEVCPYCDKNYKSKISLYYHMKKGNCRGLSTKEVPEGFMRCTDCLQIFANADRFEIHKAKGACRVSYRCVHCGLGCKSEDKLEAHIKKGGCLQQGSKKPREKKRRKVRLQKAEDTICCSRCNNFNRDCCCSFTCRLCNKKIFSVGAYMTHQREHRGEVDKSDVVIWKKSRPMFGDVKRKRRKKRGTRGKGKKTEVSEEPNETSDLTLSVSNSGELMETEDNGVPCDEKTVSDINQSLSINQSISSNSPETIKNGVYGTSTELFNSEEKVSNFSSDINGAAIVTRQVSNLSGINDIVSTCATDNGDEKSFTDPTESLSSKDQVVNGANKTGLTNHELLLDSVKTNTSI